MQSANDKNKYSLGDPFKTALSEKNKKAFADMTPEEKRATVKCITGYDSFDEANKEKNRRINSGMALKGVWDTYNKVVSGRIKWDPGMRVTDAEREMIDQMQLKCDYGSQKASLPVIPSKAAADQILDLTGISGNAGGSGGNPTPNNPVTSSGQIIANTGKLNTAPYAPKKRLDQMTKEELNKELETKGKELGDLFLKESKKNPLIIKNPDLASAEYKEKKQYYDGLKKRKDELAPKAECKPATKKVLSAVPQTQLDKQIQDIQAGNMEIKKLQQAFDKAIMAVMAANDGIMNNDALNKARDEALNALNAKKAQVQAMKDNLTNDERLKTEELQKQYIDTADQYAVYNDEEHWKANGEAKKAYEDQKDYYNSIIDRINETPDDIRDDYINLNDNQRRVVNNTVNRLTQDSDFVNRLKASLGDAYTQYGTNDILQLVTDIVCNPKYAKDAGIEEIEEYGKIKKIANVEAQKEGINILENISKEALAACQKDPYDIGKKNDYIQNKKSIALLKMFINRQDQKLTDELAGNTVDTRLYTDPNDLAKDVGAALKELTDSYLTDFGENKEFGAVIYKNKKTGEYTISGIWTGERFDKDSVIGIAVESNIFNNSIFKPEEYEVVGTIHTHPKGGGNAFSGEDMTYLPGISYLCADNGSLYKNDDKKQPNKNLGNLLKNQNWDQNVYPNYTNDNSDLRKIVSVFFPSWIHN